MSPLASDLIYIVGSVESWTRDAAIATACAAVVTAILAAATRKAAKETAKAAKAAVDEAEATQRLVGLNQQQMRRAQMPVVMPIANTRGQSEERGRPKLIGGGVLLVPVSNVGSGPAFSIEAEITFLDAVGQPSVGPQPPLVHGAVYTALGVGDAVALRAEFRQLVGLL